MTCSGVWKSCLPYLRLRMLTLSLIFPLFLRTWQIRKGDGHDFSRQSGKCVCTKQVSSRRTLTLHTQTKTSGITRNGSKLRHRCSVCQLSIYPNTPSDNRHLWVTLTRVLLTSDSMWIIFYVNWSAAISMAISYDRSVLHRHSNCPS